MDRVHLPHHDPQSTTAGLRATRLHAVGTSRSLPALVVIVAMMTTGSLADSSIRAIEANIESDGRIAEVMTGWRNNAQGTNEFPLDRSGAPIAFAAGGSVLCPDGAAIEQEACGENSNSGCDSAFPAFEPIECGQTVCGTAWATNAMRDLDWYEFTLTQTATITICVSGDLPMRFGPVLNIVSGDCSSPGAGFHGPSGLVMPGEELCLSRTFAPGTWWIFVAPAVFAGYPCGTSNDYIITLTCESCVGDLNGDDGVDGADLGILLSQWGRGGLGDLNGDGIVDGADLGILLSNWGGCEITTPPTCGDESAGDCCSANGSPFCDDLECCFAVCAGDMWCCAVQWDSICAEDASFVCPPCAPSTCCSVQTTAGCDDLACETAVCAEMPSCCTVAWDAMCLAHAHFLCDVCPFPSCGLPASNDDCCDFFFSGGCSDLTCCSLICSLDPWCCTYWDYPCRILANQLCDVCDVKPPPPPVCGTFPNGNCCLSNGTPGCSDLECCEAICAVEPFCCDVTWDVACSQLALAQCDVCKIGCEPPPNNNCQDADWAEIPPGASHIFTGNNQCATFDCVNNEYGQGHVWISFTLLADGPLLMEFCGSEPGWGEFWLNLAKSCPCTTGTPAAQFNFTCDDGNGRLWWNNMPAGTYWYPVLLREEAGAIGNYVITVSTVPYEPPPPPCPGVGDCCSANDTPGCDDTSCCLMVCDEDPACCSQAWDQVCVEIARAFCVDCTCTLGEGPCCTPHGGLGCEDEDCCFEVCTAIDPSCCEYGWDSWCASFAWEICAVCPKGIGTPGEGECCYFGNGTGGCADASCQAAVCSCDPFCCSNEWDVYCATFGVPGTECGAIALCGCPVGNSTCCYFHPLPGCDDPSCEAAVCACDPFCCQVVWDANCAGPNEFTPGCSAIELCGGLCAID